MLHFLSLVYSHIKWHFAITWSHTWCKIMNVRWTFFYLHWKGIEVQNPPIWTYLMFSTRCVLCVSGRTGLSRRLVSGHCGSHRVHDGRRVVERREQTGLLKKQLFSFPLYSVRIDWLALDSLLKIGQCWQKVRGDRMKKMMLY